MPIRDGHGAHVVLAEIIDDHVPHGSIVVHNQDAVILFTMLVGVAERTIKRQLAAIELCHWCISLKCTTSLCETCHAGLHGEKDRPASRTLLLRKPVNSFQERDVH